MTTEADNWRSLGEVAGKVIEDTLDRYLCQSTRDLGNDLSDPPFKLPIGHATVVSSGNGTTGLGGD